jgi:predicted ATPase
MLYFQVIEKIRVKNFRSFKDLELNLGALNIVIGANASGKSNFVQIFKFLRDITIHGLENAISLQGGIEYLRNINIGSSENLSLEVLCKSSKEDDKLGDIIGIKPFELVYNLTIEFKKKGIGFSIAEDKLTWKFNVNTEIEEMTISNINGRLEAKHSIGMPVVYGLFPSSLKEAPPQSLLIERQYSFMRIFSLMSLDNTSVYDFNPKLPKGSAPITGKADLDEDGKNLSIVLKNIASNKEKKRKFTNLITDLLPFVQDIKVDRQADKSLLFKLKEIYSQKEYIPAHLISDGTINIAALIIALYFDKKSLTIIEEPERNIHPYLMSGVVNMMKDASRNKQIIVTTHNPEMVRHADIEDILIVSRDEEGFTHISNPMDKEETRVFLENEMGLADLFVDNLLEV